MRVLVNAVSAKMGGAANYIRHLAVEMAAWPGLECVFVVPEQQAKALAEIKGIHVIASSASHAGPLRRLWFDQVTLRHLAIREKIDVLYSTANMGMLSPPCRQVLLVRNALHFSDYYLSVLLPREGWSSRLENWLRRHLISASVRSSNVVITPTRAMLNDFRRLIAIPEEKSAVNHYGVDASSIPRKQDYGQSSKNGEGILLYSSLYAGHKNLTTLLRALIMLNESGVRCRLISSADPHAETAVRTCTSRQDRKLARDPRIESRIQWTGILDSQHTAELYCQADVLVYPSAVESFGHPLLEAMAAGLPVVAADTAVNRELCQDAALYFPTLDAESCSRQVARLLSDPELQKSLAARGLARIQDFLWSSHVERLVASLRNQTRQTVAGAA